MYNMQCKSCEMTVKVGNPAKIKAVVCWRCTNKIINDERLKKDE